jgi:DNA-directed RNA polymerase specialized sigma24 family protein
MSTTSFPEKIGRELCKVLDCDSSQVNIITLYRVIQSRIHSWGLSEVTADDILGRLCIECREAITQGKRINNPTAWLMKVSLHLMIDELKTKDKNKRIICDSEIADSAASELAYEDKGEDEFQHSNRDKAMQAIKTLKPLDRKIMRSRTSAEASEPRHRQT